MSHGSFSQYNDFICVTRNCTKHSRVGKMLKGTFHFLVLTSGVPQDCTACTKLSGKPSVTCLVSLGYVPYNNSGVCFLLIFELPSQKPKAKILL